MSSAGEARRRRVERPARWAKVTIACAAALALAGCAQAGPLSALTEGNRSTTEPTPATEPPAPKQEERDGSGRRAADSPAEPHAEQETETSPAPIPPASAGSNGSFVPSAAARSSTITPRTHAALNPQAAGAKAVLLNGIALAPPQAPAAIDAAIGAANMLVGRPYEWGGGHGSWYSPGYDCSGAVSFALAGGNFLTAPLSSSQFESWGEPGPGRWLTVYANAGHTYAVIAGLRWDTVGDARGSGPRWHPNDAYPAGFVARHPPGY